MRFEDAANLLGLKMLVGPVNRAFWMLQAFGSIML